MKSILLIGLGRFGKHVAIKLNKLGHQVMAVDSSEERVSDVLPFVTNAIKVRMGGDEFLVVIPEMSKREISFKTKKMRSVFRKEYDWIAAVGYGFAQKPETLHEIIRDAESSMYMDKHEYYRFHPRYTY